MGKRAILAAVLFWLLVAGLQVWLVSAMLSRPLPSGRTGWEVIATDQAKRRSSNMSLVEGVSITYKCGNAVYGSTSTSLSDGATIRLRFNDYIPGHGYAMAAVYFSVGESAILCGETEGYYGPFPQEADFPLLFGAPESYPVPSGQYELLWLAGGLSGSTGLFLSVDADTLPTFTTSTIPECNPGGIGVAEWFVTAVVDNQPTSWSYEIYSGSGATGSRIYAGSVNPAPSPPACSAWMEVTGIPRDARSVKLIATNANGTAETVVNLSLPVPQGLSISADPPGILEGQEVTLNWTVGAGVSSAEIDNGIGLVYSIIAPSLRETSGSVTVSPTETTTYTITARGSCAEITRNVTVFVQAVPRVQSAMIRLIAQEGLASAKTARVDQSAKMRLIANDLDRRTHRKVAGHRFNIQPAETRTPHEKVAGHRFNIRAERRKVSGHRFDVRATRTKVAGHRFRVLYPDRMHVYARNTATGAVLDLGAIEMDAAELVLTDVAIAPGTYEFWTERESTFWKSNRSRDSQIVRLASGVPPAVDPLPAVINLAASVSRAVTTITWDVSHPIAEWGLNFGLWFSETSPVATFVTPTALVEASKMRTSYSAIRRQSGAEYVAVALIGSDGSLGQAAELELPWGTVAPVSPSNQTVGG
ncbi:MAG: hypothetical protein GX616_12420 [Planctomycetes bacterium]|nr:hypothetical protein [Planctomycetota bacterium]